MILWFRNLIAYLICAIASTAIAHWVKSSVAVDILIPNLTAIIIALLAINVQTTAVIAVKLRELADKHGHNFRLSIAEFRLAIYEQGGLVVASLALSTIAKSKIEVLSPLALECFSFFAIYASLHIFLDTSVGLLISLFPEADKPA
jgi:hypothetical protein